MDAESNEPFVLMRFLEAEREYAEALCTKALTFSLIKDFNGRLEQVAPDEYMEQFTLGLVLHPGAGRFTTTHTTIRNWEEGFREGWYAHKAIADELEQERARVAEEKAEEKRLKSEARAEKRRASAGTEKWW